MSSAMNYLKVVLSLLLPIALAIICPGTGTSTCNPGIPPNIQIAPGTSLTIPLNFDINCVPSNIEVEASAGLHISGNLNTCTLTADASFSGTGSISISWCDLSGNPGSSNSTCECLCDTTAAPTTTTAAPTTLPPTTTTTLPPTTTTTLPPTTTTLAPTTTTLAPTTTPAPPSGCANGPPSNCLVSIPTEVSFCGCEGQKTFSFMFPSCSVVSYNVSYGVDAGLKAAVTKSDTSVDVTISVEGTLSGYAWIQVDWCDSTGGHGVQNTTCYVYPQENVTTTPATTTPAPTTPAPTSEGYQVYLSDNQKDNTDYGKRDTDMKSLNIPGFASGLYYYSIDQNVHTDVNVSSNGGVFGAAYQFNGPLVSFLTYFNVSSNWNMGLNPATADTSKAISLIGSCYLGLLEIMGDINGNYTVIQETKFRNLQWEVSSVNTVSEVKYATFTGKDSNQPNFQVSITFMIAANGVTINTGAQLSPKSVEAVINILNYRFKAQDSSLALQMGVGTAAYGDVTGLLEVNGYHRIVAGSGESGVYWDGATQCMTNRNGDMTDVIIVAKDVDSTQMDGAGFVSQCQQTKQAQPQMNVNYTLITIVFPQSDNLTYDPSVGVDAFPNGTVRGQGNAASSLRSPSFIVLMFSILSLIKFF